MLQSRSKGRKRLMSQLRAVRQEAFSLIWGRVNLFVLSRPSTDWMRPTHVVWWGQSALFSSPIQMLIASRNTFTDILRIISDPWPSEVNI